MIKFTHFETQHEGELLMHVLHPDHQEMIKQAVYLPELQEKIAKLEKKPNKTYVLINAMTAGEKYGPNLNGDFFAEDQLQKYHKTFETHGHAYKHHQNKNPELARGKVIMSIYNNKNHRVELIVELDNDKAADILEELNSGKLPPVSMGTKTPSDSCSICHHRSKNVHEYCEHLQTEMNRVYPDGRKVMAINDAPLTFFDISFVRKPADRTASVITKIADTQSAPTIPSALLGEQYLKESGLKEADIIKEIEPTIEAMDTDPRRLILRSQRDLPKELIDKLANSYSLSELLSTMLGLRIMPKPEEFQRLVLKCSKNERMHRLAEDADISHKILMNLEEGPSIPIDINYQGFNDDAAKELIPYFEDVSMLRPRIIKRILIKMGEEMSINSTSVQSSQSPTEIQHTTAFAPIKNPIIPLLGLGGLYLGYNKLFGTVVPETAAFEKFLLSKPWLIPVVLGAAAATTVAAQSVLFNKTSALKPDANFLKRLLVTVPSSYLYSGYAESKVQKGEPISDFQDLVRKHPFLTGVAGMWGLGKLQKYLKAPSLVKTSQTLGSLENVIHGLSLEKFEKLYNDVVGIDIV
jgi:hypothetical protein